MRATGLSFALCLLIACGEDEPERNAPPVGSGGGGPVTAGGGVATTDSGSDTDTDTDTAGSTGSGGLTMGPDSADPTTGGMGSYAVLSGSFLDGGGGYSLPIQCSVEFHLPGQINPSNGNVTSTTFSRSFLVESFPRSFTIMNDEIGDVVETGDTGYVSSRCDVDSNGFFDDDSGAFFPSLPMLEITIPASSIDLSVGPL